jgi:hypothetical protein
MFESTDSKNWLEMNVCLNQLHLMTQLVMNLSSSIASEPYDAFLETDLDKKHVERIFFSTQTRPVIFSVACSSNAEESHLQIRYLTDFAEQFD